MSPWWCAVPVHVVPRDLFGRPTQHTNVLLSHLPLALRDAIAMATIGLVVGDLSRWGIVRPKVGPNRMIEESGRIPILDLGTIAMVKQGKIRVLPAVEEILPDSVRFAGGAVHPFEAIIFATGYTPGLGNVIAGFETIADARGRPHRFGEETGIAGLYFVGFKNPPTGRAARDRPRGSTGGPVHSHHRRRSCDHGCCIGHTSRLNWSTASRNSMSGSEEAVRILLRRKPV